jgi:hypothetical protein
LLPRSPRTLTNRDLLNTRGEIVVGAFARAQFRRRLIIAAIGVVLITAAVVIYVSLRSSAGAPGETFPVAVSCIDPKCGYTGELRVPRATLRFPVKCPRCAKTTCQQLWECRDCGTQFVPSLVLRDDSGDPKRVHPGTPFCPNCRSTVVGVAEKLRPARKE